ncbi:hypothetical protein [Weissella confusa]|uniref:hypothetical protein n=2 Tax=Weissella confusa TaxID=1583 RepID=UPI00223C2501|nr:hypothetical protein [Weissella confusa]MCT0013521.1 hypothetical protein [Weissella confusa]
MKSRNIVLMFILWTLGIIAWYWQFPNFASSGDTFFHASRVLEIRNAFKSGSMPPLLAMTTFHHVGTAIPGMYPDFFLWPLVLITNWLSFTHQILMIRIITLWLTFWVTYIVLRKRNHNVADFNLAVLSLIFTLSGYALYTAFREFQPNTALIYAFSLPIFWTTKDWLNENQFNWRISIKLGMVAGFIALNHLLSVVVYLMLIIPFLLYKLYKKNWRLLLNGTVAGLTALILASPFLLRYAVLIQNKMLMPFGQGNVKGTDLIKLLTEATWGARTSFATPMLLLIIIGLVYFGAENRNRDAWLTLGLLALYSSQDMLWALINKVPYFNSLQYTPWRFAIYLSIPIVVMLSRISTKRWMGILTIMSGVTILAATQFAYANSSRTAPIANTLPKSYDTNVGVFLIDEKDLQSDRLTRTIVQDYAPASMGTDSGSLSEKGKNVFLYHTVTDRKNNNFMVHSFGTSKVVLNTEFKVERNDKLPVFAYQGWKYVVKINGKKVESTVSRGLLSVKREILPGSEIVVNARFKYQKAYNTLIVLSIFAWVLASTSAFNFEKNKS